jgi:hypothetical protein
MHYDGVKVGAAGRDGVHHALELRTVGGCRRRSRLDEFRDDAPTSSLAKLLGLSTLIRN